MDANIVFLCIMCISVIILMTNFAELVTGLAELTTKRMAFVSVNFVSSLAIFGIVVAYIACQLVK